MEWQYDPTVNPLDYEAFVYLITNLKTGQMYVGKKTIWSRPKGRSTVESDWRSYWGSSDLLAEAITTYGQDNFRREVLHWCMTRGDATYLEAKEQFARDVLASDAYYNRNILSTFFHHPGQQTERKPLRVVRKKPRITLKMKRLIWASDNTQQQLANEFDLTVAEVRAIQREQP